MKVQWSLGLLLAIAVWLFAVASMAAEPADPFQSAPVAAPPKQPPTPNPAAPAVPAVTAVPNPAPAPNAAPGLREGPPRQQAPVDAEAIPPGAVRVASGVEGRVAWHVSWSDSCVGRPVSIKVLEFPAHGTLRINDELVPIPSRAEVGTVPSACVGRPISGKRLYYQSQAGYRGADRIVVQVYTPSGDYRSAVDIAVR